MESQSEKSDEARDPSSTTPSTHTTNRAGNIFIMGSEALRNHPPVAQAPDRPLGEIISQEFSPFDAETLIAKPFVDHETSDDKFEVELSTMLMEALIETHAWTVARPRYETSVTTDHVNSKLVKVEQIEREQEQTRRKLAEFVKKMRSALEALVSI